MSSFDLKVNHRDPKSGQVVSSNPYRLIIENGRQLFERPPGSGHIFNADGSVHAEPVKKEAHAAAHAPVAKK